MGGTEALEVPINFKKTTKFIPIINPEMIKGYMYILICADGSYYTGSTKYLRRRLAEHQNGEGAIYTRQHGPVRLVYYEAYTRIDWAFYREKQVQGWSRAKKRALIEGRFQDLPNLAIAYRDLE